MSPVPQFTDNLSTQDPSKIVIKKGKEITVVQNEKELVTKLNEAKEVTEESIIQEIDVIEKKANGLNGHNVEVIQENSKGYIIF